MRASDAYRFYCCSQQCNVSNAVSKWLFGDIINKKSKNCYSQQSNIRLGTGAVIFLMSCSMIIFWYSVLVLFTTLHASP